MAKTRQRTTEVVAESEEDEPEPDVPVVASLSGWQTTVDLELESRFTRFADLCHRFSREVVEQSGMRVRASTAEHARLNMQIARAVFSKWSIEILAILYTGRRVRFHEIKTALADVSSRVLSLKLARLERLGLVRRSVLGTRPPRVEYSLTDSGLHVARLGEPVFLYLRLTQGLLHPGGI